MYYEEKEVNGVKYCRTEPNGAWREVINPMVSTSVFPSPTSEKVYCRQCVNFLVVSGGIRSKATISCTHEDNKKYYDTFEMRRFKYISSPEKMNKRNNCSLFQRIEEPQISNPPRRP
jgi:hypothetical protein